MRKFAFTLIELLVVIAIIAILAAILFPVFAKAKEAAKKTQGLAQMKQIGTSLHIYVTDYDDGIPTWNVCLATYPTTARPAACPLGLFHTTYYWDNLLLPYVKNGKPDTSQYSGVWRSPGAEFSETAGRSVGMNQLAMWNPEWDNSCTIASTNPFTGCYYWLNLGQVDASSSTIYIGDSGKGGRQDPIYFLNAWAESWLPTYAEYRFWNWATPWRYGRNTANYVMMDSSAKSHSGDKIYVNPGHTFGSLAWPSSASGATYCAARKWQAPTLGMKNFMNTQAANRGVTCTD